MLFSSLIFLFVFLPLVIIGNYLIKPDYRNVFLLFSSLIFFAWGGVSYSLILILSLIINYIIGRLIGSSKTKKKSQIYLTIGIVINLIGLGVFKYADFIIENINVFSSVLSFKPIKNLGIVLPIGISFYTFQAISYVIDIYRKDVAPQKSFVKMALYISFFPQLIAGPIIRYKTIEKQIDYRKGKWINIRLGLQRFALGLSKKILIANQLGHTADFMFGGFHYITSLELWIGILAYSLQIYFDFSGYSDMAIGLGRMLGFKFPENFNFPYTATSIREFWKRWHITLSDWFRSYLYFPLGGNRKGKYRTILNLFIIFFTTGIWHGASWNFVAWGMIHGVFMVLERIGLGKLLQKTWKPLQHIYTLLIVMIAWIFFRADNVTIAFQYINKMFSFDGGLLSLHFIHIANNAYIFTFCIAILSVTHFWIFNLNLLQRLEKKLNIRNSVLSIYNVGEIIIPQIAIILSVAFMVAQNYNPFIYFRF